MKLLELLCIPALLSIILVGTWITLDICYPRA